MSLLWVDITRVCCWLENFEELHNINNYIVIYKQVQRNTNNENSFLERISNKNSKNVNKLLDTDIRYETRTDYNRKYRISRLPLAQ